MSAPTRYTIVQHSAAGYAGDGTFSKGLETRSTNLKSEQARVTRAGGLLFASYNEADDYIDSESYPPGTNGLVPNAPGEFSELDIDGLRIYVPRSQ